MNKRSKEGESRGGEEAEGVGAWSAGGVGVGVEAVTPRDPAAFPRQRGTPLCSPK